MHFLFLLFLLLSSACAVSQTKNKADVYFEKKRYQKAYTLYLKEIEKGFFDSTTIAKASSCAELLGNNDDALQLYALLDKSFQLTPNQIKQYVYLLCSREEYASAANIINRYKSKYSAGLKRLQITASIDSAIAWQSYKAPIVVNNLEKLNTKYADFAPAKFQQGLIFCSNREEVIIRRKSERDGEPFSNIYLIDDLQTEYKSVSFPSVNTTFHEGPATFSKNFDTIFFSRNGEGKYDSHLKLYSSVKQKGQWKEPGGFMLNDSTFSFAHPSISKDGNLFFFASDMPGGYGGSDLYVCIKADSNWSLPINLGNEINTPENEIFPFYTLEGNLYFSSEGHTGMGGYDVFCSQQSDGNWLSPQNLKPPINSGADDYGFIIYSKWPDAYFSSNRKGGKGKSDIYRVTEKN